MLHGVIDIGSNTIRLSIYRIEAGQIRRLLHKKEMVGLASYIQNKILVDKGIDKACTVLDDYKDILNNFAIEKIYVFATASLRNICNTVEAIEAIRNRTGFVVDVISGKKEAILDFVGALQSVSIENGLLVDIGGGSTELVVYRDTKIVETCSLPIGSLNLYTEYIENLFPTQKEKKMIRKRVKEELKQHSLITGIYPNICGVGGTVRALLRLTNAYMGFLPSHTEIETNHLKRAVKQLAGSEKERLNVIMETAPDRVRTLMTGLIILETIIKEYCVETIVVSASGVREGYLYCKAVEAWEDV